MCQDIGATLGGVVAEHGISRKSFHELRKRATADVPAAVLEPRSRRPLSSPSKQSGEVKDQALRVSAAWEASGFDPGPVSVHEKMRAKGLPQEPPVASLPRIFREAGVARLEPRTKPRPGGVDASTRPCPFPISSWPTPGRSTQVGVSSRLRCETPASPRLEAPRRRPGTRRCG